jgi:hypothetical protein
MTVYFENCSTPFATFGGAGEEKNERLRRDH